MEGSFGRSFLGLVCGDSCHEHTSPPQLLQLCLHAALTSRQGLREHDFGQMIDDLLQGVLRVQEVGRPQPLQQLLVVFVQDLLRSVGHCNNTLLIVEQYGLRVLRTVFGYRTEKTREVDNNDKFDDSSSFIGGG